MLRKSSSIPQYKIIKLIFFVDKIFPTALPLHNSQKILRWLARIHLIAPVDKYLLFRPQRPNEIPPKCWIIEHRPLNMLSLNKSRTAHRKKIGINDLF